MKAGKPEKETIGEIELSGKVIKKKFAVGSKSEHNAVYLETKEGTFRLRRLGGNPFVDPELSKLVGKKVKATGKLNESIFFANKLSDID